VPAGLWVAGTGLAVLLLGVLLYVVLPVAFAAAARWGARVRERRDARGLARVAEQSRPARGGAVARRQLLPTKQLNRIWLVLAILALLFPFVAMIVELSFDDPIPAAVVGVMMIVFFAVVIAAWRIGARRGAALPASPASPASTDSLPPAAHPTAPAAPEPAPRQPDGSDS
jgi:ABC-type antimicrobial peptide transport system permease subunit